MLLIGIDGARWDVLAAAASTIARMAAEGSWHRMTMDAPTISAPGWGSLLTGASHGQHGWYDNDVVGRRAEGFPDFLTRSQARAFAAVSWPVLADPILHLPDVFVADGETMGYRLADQLVLEHSLSRLDSVDLGFVYFGEVDEAGHNYGVGREYSEAARRVDALVNTLIDAVPQDWLIVLTTDHGHLDEGGHGGDSDRERESWVVAWSAGGSLPDWPAEISPYELSGLLLAAR